MADRRRANEHWNPARDDGTITWERVDTALLMDLRDELQKLNALLHCQNFQQIPATLKAIHRKMPARQPRKRRA